MFLPSHDFMNEIHKKLSQLNFTLSTNFKIMLKDFEQDL